jgi:ubiquinone/menaquinone biosynthesis C-methylase UbiE
MAEPQSVAEAYSRTGAAWRAGPERVYRRLAAELVARSPIPLTGRLVLDLGAGTGAATVAIRAAGGRPIAADVAPGMLAAMGADRPPLVAADALALPLRSGGVDVVVAAFSVNHLVDPGAGLREARRVTRAGGAVLASSYAHDDAHPAKQAVEEAAGALGWTAPAWYRAVRADAVPRLATVEGMEAAARRAGLVPHVTAVRFPFPDFGAADLVAWRVGMAQLAPFVEGLPPDARTQLVADAVARLGPDHPPLVRSILVMVARV